MNGVFRKSISCRGGLKGGLVRSIHKTDKLLDDAKEIAHEITKNCAPVSVALSRQMLWKMAGADHPMEAHKIDSRGIFARGRMQDAKGRYFVFRKKMQTFLMELEICQITFLGGMKRIFIILFWCFNFINVSFKNQN